MRMIRNLVSLCLTLMMLCTPAMAEVSFLMHSDGWDIAETPLEVMLSAQVQSLMPYDDERLAMLQDVLNNLSMRLTTDNEKSSISILVGQSEVFSIREQQNEVQVSSLPGQSFYAAEDNAMDLLLGNDAGGISIYNLSIDAETLLKDGWTLLTSIDNALSQYAERRNVKTSIENMGTARSCTDYSVPKADTDSFKDTLLSLCPDGWLREILSNLTFSGKQTLRIYRTEEEIPLRMEYNGTCGVGDDLRTVKLVWRTRRDNTAYRDELTLTSPAKSGSNKNTLEFSRIIKKNKAGAMELTGSFSYTAVLNKQTTVRKGEFALKNKFTKSSDEITGSVTIQQKLPGESSYSSMKLTPELTITGTSITPAVEGTIGVAELLGKNVLNQANIRLSLQRNESTAWSPCEQSVNLDSLSEDELAALRQAITDSAATEIVRMLIILMQDEADWFFRDLSPEVVQQILDASDRVVIQ